MLQMGKQKMPPLSVLLLLHIHPCMNCDDFGNFNYAIAVFLGLAFCVRTTLKDPVVSIYRASKERRISWKR